MSTIGVWDQHIDWGTPRPRRGTTDKRGDGAGRTRAPPAKPTPRRRKPNCASEKKRRRESPAAEGEGLAPAVAEMRALLERTLVQMTHVLVEVELLERRSDGLERRCRAQEERCRFLEARCDSLERSVQILVKNQSWEYSAPAIPSSYWTERGFGDEYVAQMETFVESMKEDTCSMMGGDENIARISLGHRSGNEMLLHNEALLPHWREFSNALQLCNYSGSLEISNVQLPSLVCDMLTPALATKKIPELVFNGTHFSNPSDGIQFSVKFMKSNQNLKSFMWKNNPIDAMDNPGNILEAIICHPSLENISLENCFRSNVGYAILCSLLTSSKSFSSIHFSWNNVHTMGRTHLSEYLATDPPLKHLSLHGNHLTDNDAISIAGSLKRNTNLKSIHIGGNDITDVGQDALRDAIFDPKSLNALAGSNHTCWIAGLDVFDINNEFFEDVKALRGRKLYCSLAWRYQEGTFLNDLNLEFGDNALKFAPEVLECVHLYSGYVRPRVLKLMPKPLSVVYELLRGWKMPELYENRARR